MMRHARREDLEALLDIYNHEVLFGTATFDLEKKTLREWEAWYVLHTGNYALRVWEEDGRAVGYATLSPYREKEVYLGTVELSVYVHREYQGRGIGTELIKEILRIARENPAVHTVVSVITGSNDRSRKLHEQLGFFYCGKVREAGYKFGTYLDIDTYQILVTQTGDSGIRKK